MNTIQSIEFYTAINLFIIGLSHLMQPKIWVDFFVFLYSKKHAGNIVNALISLSMGSLIVSFHFVWSLPQVLITVFGALQVVKGMIYLLIPAIGISAISKVTIEKAYKFKWAGLAIFILSLVIIYGLIVDKAFK